MYAQWVEIFHVAYRDTVVIAVAHNLIFYFFPAFQALLYENLRRERESLFGQFVKLFLVVAESAAQPAKGVCGPEDNGVAQFLGCLAGLLNVFARLALDGLDANLIEFFYEKLAVFGVHDSLDGCAEHAYVVFFKHSALMQRHTAVECCLSAESQQYAVGALLFDYALYEIRLYGQEINLVGNPLGCLDGRDIWVYQYGIYSFFTQCLQRL